MRFAAARTLTGSSLSCRLRSRCDSGDFRTHILTKITHEPHETPAAYSSLRSHILPSFLIHKGIPTPSGSSNIVRHGRRPLGVSMDGLEHPNGAWGTEEPAASPEGRIPPSGDAAAEIGEVVVRVRNIYRFIGISAAATLLLSACTSVVPGSAVLEAGDANPDGVDLSALNPGNYPTQPRPPRPPAGSREAGAVFEGQRMATFVVGPWEVDSSLIRIVSGNTTPLEDTASLWVNFPKAVQDVAGKHGYLTGFSSARSSESDQPTKVLINSVLRFPDAPSATAAATDMGAEAMAAEGRDKPYVPHPIPGHPEAVGMVGEVTRDDKTLATVQSFTPHGIYVLYQWSQAEVGGADAATAMVVRALDLGLPRIDSFRPADPWRFADLPTDPMNLLLRTLPLLPNDRYFSPMGSYPPQAALHYETDPIASTRLFETADVEAVAMINSVVYRTRDAESAHLIADFAAQQFKSVPTDRQAAGVPGIPDSRCFDRRSNDAAMKAAQSQFFCVVTSGKYSFKTSSQQLDDAHQRAAAQFLMLIAP